jgi:cobalt transporter subunit CbtB
MQPTRQKGSGLWGLERRPVTGRNGRLDAVAPYSVVRHHASTAQARGTIVFASVTRAVQSVPGVRSEVAGAVGALLLGVFVVFMVGFAGASVLHEAAHNTRHSIAFPCH